MRSTAESTPPRDTMLEFLAITMSKRTDHTMKNLVIFSLLSAALTPVAPADETASQRIQFERGESQAIITGEVAGRQLALYTINAREGQWLEVGMLPGVKGADFNIYIPGRAPGDEALFNSLSGDRRYTGQLAQSGDHVISVFLNRAAARRGEVADYKMLVRITDEKPAEEEMPSTEPVPQKVIDDCLAALKMQIPDRAMKVKRAERGETSFVVDVAVEGVPKPWRCYHDGTRCTGTEYQGEG